ncbi:helix-turn-helix domain-containing protein [Flavobacterium cyanobacteriorum]|nr:helix-turn-helix domain-containing protein [Flavobacterium cyanobacteriorum]
MNESNNSLNLFEDFDSTMIAIFKIDNRDQQIEYLEKYWISKLNQKNELLRLEKIIQDIEKGEKIELIARKHNLSRQYINKIFSKYLGKNPTEYRRIHRFRKAIFTYKNEKKLTNLSYENLYFDQAHFNKDFKNFTNINPKLFFNHIDSEKPVIWFYAQ